MKTVLSMTTKKNNKEKTQHFVGFNENVEDTAVALAMATLNDLTDNELVKLEKISRSGIDLSALREV